ncbi:MAG: hypothetical protein LBK61_07635 [Spirochaetaceae bacterium]|nr:hypothetical protein [Spirochaetaceae bacterium]
MKLLQFWTRISGDGQNAVMGRGFLPSGCAMPPHDGILPAKDDAELGRDE